VSGKAPVIIYWCFSCGRILAKEYALSFYRSKAWERCRAGYISKRYGIDGGMCERCRKEPGYIVHHRIHITPMNINNPDITLNERNLQFVCKNCHEIIHGYCGMQKNEHREFAFDQDGNPILKPDPPRFTE
jgi:DNA-directed RNA polymerase subunit N (RpoN/RPB10)